MKFTWENTFGGAIYSPHSLPLSSSAGIKSNDGSYQPTHPLTNSKHPKLTARHKEQRPGQRYMTDKPTQSSTTTAIPPPPRTTTLPAPDTWTYVDDGPASGVVFVVEPSSHPPALEGGGADPDSDGVEALPPHDTDALLPTGTDALLLPLGTSVVETGLVELVTSPPPSAPAGSVALGGCEGDPAHVAGGAEEADGGESLVVPVGPVPLLLLSVGKTSSDRIDPACTTHGHTPPLATASPVALGEEPLSVGTVAVAGVPPFSCNISPNETVVSSGVPTTTAPLVVTAGGAVVGSRRLVGCGS